MTQARWPWAVWERARVKHTDTLNGGLGANNTTGQPAACELSATDRPSMCIEKVRRAWRNGRC